MEEREIRICRLCFTPINDKSFDLLEGFQVQMIKTIMLPLDLSVSKDPVMCNECSQNLQKCFDFKMMCLNTEDCVKTYTNLKDPLQIDLQEVVLKELPENCKMNEEKIQICRLCFSFSSDSFTKVDTEGGVYLRNMLKISVPEMDLTLTVNPVVCQNCHNLLANQFSFIQLCAVTEGKIKKYRSTQPQDAGNTLDLYKILQQVVEVKIETELGDREAPVEFVACDPQNVALKSEVVQFEENPPRQFHAGRT
ncbi:hypothetical protein NQ318_001808 [Aromia moschata]|uniref:ZAD domain-containing protein n=1 Tax=Aromia moschata TaxID=1265417 RepID=A0AAV8Z184_9CUCU|nr:hypothetical protein NQ318_001808 [Aromia moschata]